MYRDRWAPRPAKVYQSLPRELQIAVTDAVRRICEDPVSAPGVKPLKGPLRGKRRVRVGDYRLIYAHDPRLRVVDILVLDHRRDVYRL